VQRGGKAYLGSAILMAEQAGMGREIQVMPGILMPDQGGIGRE